MSTIRNWKGETTLLLTSQTLSLLGSSLVQYALMWYVTLETKSGLYMTLFIICGFVPVFLMAPFAGIWADRFDRKKLIMASDAMIALVTLALAVVFMSGERALWLFFVAAAVRAVGSAIQGPALGAFIPQIVPTDQLTRVNGINGTIQSVIMLVSPIVSGALIALFPMQVIFMIDVVTAALAIAVLALFLKVPPHARAQGVITTSHLDDMKQGFRYIRDHKYLISYFVYLAALYILVTPAAFLTPLQVARTFGTDVWRLTAIEMAFSLGMMAGGAFLAWWGGFKNRMATLVLSGVIMAACTLGLGIVPDFWVYLAFMGVFGIAMPLFNTPSMVIVQEHVEPDYMGRVFSVLTMLNTSLMPLSMLFFGPLAEVVSIELILVITGALLFAPQILALANRRLMEAGRKPEPAPGQATEAGEAAGRDTGDGKP